MPDNKYESRRIEIPFELVDFCNYVNELIACRDEAAMSLSDDLLQSDGVCGGLSDSRKKLYQFSFLPEDYPEERWEFKLLADEIDEIADGYKRDMTVHVHRIPRNTTE